MTMFTTEISTGDAEYWPAWVNYGVPVFCVVIFLVVLTITYIHNHKVPYDVGTQTEFMKDCVLCKQPLLQDHRCNCLHDNVITGNDNAGFSHSTKSLNYGALNEECPITAVKIIPPTNHSLHKDVATEEIKGADVKDDPQEAAYSRNTHINDMSYSNSYEIETTPL